MEATVGSRVGSVVHGRLAPLAVVVVLALAACVAPATLAGCGGTPAAAGGTAAGAATPSGEAQGGSGAGQSGGQAQGQSGGSGGGSGSGSGGGSSQGGSAGSATKVVFVDVGQGDASVVRSGSWAGLIDGGPAGAQSAVRAALTRLKVRRLSAVLVSHMHADHIGALPGLVRAFRPKIAYLAGTPTAALKQAFAAAGTRLQQVRRGQSLPAWGSARARVLSPASLSGDANADSVVVLLNAAGERFLFTGDCAGPSETVVGDLCARGPPVTVLKVAHHGSRSSTSSEFLADARPRVAVVSVGPNSYGHPTREVLARLHDAGVTVYTTWKNGTVTFVVSGAGEVRRSCSRASAPVRGVTDARAGD